MNNKILYYFDYKGESFGVDTKVVLDKDFMCKNTGINADMISFYKRTEVMANGIFVFFSPLYPLGCKYLCLKKIEGKAIPLEVPVKINDIEIAIKEIIEKKNIRKKEIDKSMVFIYTIIYLLFLFLSLIFKQFYLAWIYGTVIFIKKIKEEM